MADTVWMLWCNERERTYVHRIFRTVESGQAYLVAQGWTVWAPQDVGKGYVYLRVNQRQKVRLDRKVASTRVVSMSLEEEPLYG